MYPTVRNKSEIGFPLFRSRPGNLSPPDNFYLVSLYIIRDAGRVRRKYRPIETVRNFPSVQKTYPKRTQPRERVRPGEDGRITKMITPRLFALTRVRFKRPLRGSNGYRRRAPIFIPNYRKSVTIRVDRRSWFVSRPGKIGWTVELCNSALVRLLRSRVSEPTYFNRSRKRTLTIITADFVGTKQDLSTGYTKYVRVFYRMSRISAKVHRTHWQHHCSRRTRGHVYVLRPQPRRL